MADIGVFHAQMLKHNKNHTDDRPVFHMAEMTNFAELENVAM